MTTINLVSPSIHWVGYVEPKPDKFFNKIWWHLKAVWYPRDLWETVEDFRTLLPDGRILDIKKGFRYDGLSIPRLLWRLCHPLDGRCSAAGLVHDALCRSVLVPRSEADFIFKYIMLLYDVMVIKAYTMYGAVFVAGKLTSGRSEEEINSARKYVSIIP